MPYYEDSPCSQLISYGSSSDGVVSLYAVMLQRREVVFVSQTTALYTCPLSTQGVFIAAFASNDLRCEWFLLATLCYYCLGTMHCLEFLPFSTVTLNFF